MSWQDANDAYPGPVVSVGQGGEIELPSASYAPVQGDAGRMIKVTVTPSDLPPQDVVQTVRIIFRKRQCLQYTVRNVRLMKTLDVDGTGTGWNNIFLYFAEAPEDRISTPGPVRMAHLPVQYLPPDHRSPPDAVVQVYDEEFVRPDVSRGTGP